MLSQIRKALVPLGVALALWGLSALGVTPSPDLTVQVTLVVTAVLVYFIPNKGQG